MKNNTAEDAHFREKFRTVFGPPADEREFEAAHKAILAPSRLATLRKQARKHEIQAAAAQDGLIRERYVSAFNKTLARLRRDVERLKAERERDELANDSPHAAKN